MQATLSIYTASTLGCQLQLVRCLLRLPSNQNEGSDIISLFYLRFPRFLQPRSYHNESEPQNHWKKLSSLYKYSHEVFYFAGYRRQAFRSTHSCKATKPKPVENLMFRLFFCHLETKSGPASCLWRREWEFLRKTQPKPKSLATSSHAPI